MSPKFRRPTRSTLGVLFLMLAIFAVSCEKRESAEKEADEAKRPAVANPAPAPALTDARIVAIVQSANTVDIENAKMALSKTRNAAVEAFANQMVTEQTSVNKQASDLATKLVLKPEKSATSKQLEESSEATRKLIEGAKGGAFDKAYIDNEVAYHQAVVDMLERTLIPGAATAELKSWLESLRPVFEAHLDHARHVQAALPR